MFQAIKEFFGWGYKAPEVKPEVKAEVAPVPVKQTSAPKKAQAKPAATKTRSTAIAKGTKGRKKK